LARGVHATVGGVRREGLRHRDPRLDRLRRVRREGAEHPRVPARSGRRLPAGGRRGAGPHRPRGRPQRPPVVTPTLTPVPMGIRVFHCDDSEAFTRLVSFWLAEHDDIEYAGAAHSADAALRALPDARADVILLDTLGKPGDNS